MVTNAGNDTGGKKKKKRILLREPSGLSWEQSVLGRAGADRNDHPVLCLVSPWKRGPRIAQEKKEDKGEIQIIGDVSSKNVRCWTNRGQMS